jgi:dipeptidyl-peptidase-4
MTRKFFFLLTLMAGPWLTFAQTRLLTIDEATGMNPSLRSASLPQLQWMGKSTSFAWVKGDALLRGDAGSAGTDTLMTLTSLNQVAGALLEKPLKKIPAVTFLDEKKFFFSNGNNYFLIDLSGPTARKVNGCDPEAGNVDLEKSTFKIACTKGNNLFIAYRDKTIPVTSDSLPGIVNGSDRVHRNEFGISKGTFWSPKGNMLAFYRMDESRVADYPLVDISQRIAVEKPVKYPMAGMTSHQVTLGVYDTRTGKTTFLHTPYLEDPSATITPEEKDDMEYLTNVTWSPDERYIYIACLNRDQNHMKFNKYDAATGHLVKTLFEERSDKYVEPDHPAEFLGDASGRFIWMSARDGYNHLYLYDSEGNLLRQLTSGPWVVTRFLRSDPASGKTYFLCNRDNPLESRLYAVSVKNGDLTPLTATQGTHDPLISGDANYILDKFNSFSVTSQVELLDSKGKRIRVILENSNPLKDFNLGRTSVFPLKNEENTDLYCRLIRPVDFDSTKKYPVIIYVYGGPHSQMVTNSWLGGGGLFLNYLAEQGYVVFTLDNRGTSNRGQAFEQAIFRQLGKNELADQMTGVKFLKSLPWVDTTRIGINGWSYGGFMTITMMLKHPGTFKVGVCGGPVIDWKYYEVMYGERYMDTPESNPEGYKNACLLNYVKDLRGKLLIIHDDQDETVVPQNSLTFLKKCVDEKKQVDFFIYPGHEHNVRGTDRVHLNQKMVQYFKDFL